MDGQVVGSVTALWRYPVKSMQGERIDRSEVTAAGLPGDRRWALVDPETGKVASAKRPRLWGRLLECHAALADDGVLVTLPDGTSVDGRDRSADEALSALLDRPVQLTEKVPESMVFEERWEKEKEGHYGTVVEVDDGEEVLDVRGAFAARGTFFDFSALHVVATSSLTAVASELGAPSVDVARFRPNLLVDVPADAGFVENGWVGRTLRVGESMRLQGVMATMRCVMTTLAQPGLPADREVLRATNRANRVEVPPLGTYPCLGLYASVVDGGEVAVGDQVVVE